MNVTNQEMLDVAERVARAAGEIVKPLFADGVTVRIKYEERRNLVTDADVAADRLIHERLRAAFPDHAIFSEETAGLGDRVDPSAPTWIVDPIDGTSNFTRGLPLYSISLALFLEGRGQVAVVYAPEVDWCFCAAAGQGSTLNGRPLQASTQEMLDEAIVGCDWPRDPVLRRRAVGVFGEFAEEAHTLRTVGSAALGLAMVAAGWLSLYWHLTLEPWDVAGAQLIVQEAGGRVTTLDGAPWTPATGGVLASSGLLHEEGLAILQGHLQNSGPPRLA